MYTTLVYLRSQVATSESISQYVASTSTLNTAALNSLYPSPEGGGGGGGGGSGSPGATGATGATGAPPTSLSYFTVSGTSLTGATTPAISTSTVGVYYNITNPAFSNLTAPSSGMISGQFWVLRNSTQDYLNITTTGVPSGIPSPLIIPPSNATTLVADSATSIILF